MSFLKIITLYEGLELRNLDYLSSLYKKPEYLKVSIDKLIRQNFTESLNERRILLKPNWVKHPKHKDDLLCLTTNMNFILAVLEVILEFGPASVIIGDAPIQGCVWENLITDSFIHDIKSLSEKYKIPVKVTDFRRTTFIPGQNLLTTERRPLSEYVIFDLGKKSYLEPITDYRGNKFRVTNYDSSRLANAHKPGMHKYCITRELFEADVIISLPKIKTHQKTGITGALKNLVGLNGDKDFLPHHRIGGTGRGGDCYPGKNVLRFLSETITDEANRKRGKAVYPVLTKISSFFWKISFPGDLHSIEAGWYGNDTSWRMVMDLNLIAHFGKPDGTLSDKPQRKIYSICDGIVAGQGDGPLYPEPLPFGIISFTDNPAANDIAMVTLMGFDYRKFPLLREASELFSFDTCSITLNGEKTELNELKKHSVQTLPPRGWKIYLLNQ